MSNRALMLLVVAMFAVLLSLDAGATSYVSRDYYKVGDDCTYQIHDRSITGEVVLGTSGLIGGDNCDGEPGGLPYIIESDIVVEPTAVLRIEPGVTIKFKDGPTNFTVYGTLIADGVLFTSDGVPPFPRDWSGVRFSGPGAAHSILRNCIFEYGGASHNDVLALVQCEDGADITIENCEFSHSGLYGILADGASPKVIDCTFSSCERFPIYQRSLDSFPEYSGNVFIDNAYRGVLVASGTIECSGTWQNPGIPYVVSLFGGVGLLEIPQDITLTLEPGTTVKFISREGRLDVYGELRAEGEPLQPVTFTSFANDWAGGDSNGDGDNSAPAPGDFAGLRFFSSSSNSFLSCCLVSFAGHGRQGSAAVNLSIGANVLLNTCLIDHSLDVGLKASSANPTLLGCLFIGNKIGILCKNGSMPLIDRCSFFQNSEYAVENKSINTTVQAQNCFWGDATGPSDTSDDTATGGLYNPNGQGDRVSDGVDYSGFLQNPFLGPILSIRPNRATLSTRDSFRPLGAYANLGEERSLDLYVAVLMPTQEILFYPTFAAVPNAVFVTLPALSSLPEFELFRLQIPHSIPLGDYYVFAAGCEPGTFEFVSNIAYCHFGIY